MWRGTASPRPPFRALGPGLLESVYEACLAHELVKDGLRVERQVELPVEYDTIRLECGFRIDLLIEDQVIVELKAVEKILPIQSANLAIFFSAASVAGKQTAGFGRYQESSNPLCAR